MNFTGNILLQDRKLGEHMTIDEMMIEIKQQGYDFEHAMCDIEDSRENQVKYQEKGEQCKQLVDFLAELKKYKQLEEQGRLIKLPCKIGDAVWDIDYGRPCAYTITAFSFGECEEYICEPVTTKEAIFYYANSSGSITGSFAESEIGETVFLTKSEAEAKLKELRGGEDAAN